MSRKEISVKGAVRASTLEGQLASLLSALKKGRIFVQKGKEYVELRVPTMVNVEIAASQTKSKERLTIDLTWARANEVEESEDAAAHFKILESEPVSEDQPGPSFADASSQSHGAIETD